MGNIDTGVAVYFFPRGKNGQGEKTACYTGTFILRELSTLVVLLRCSLVPEIMHKGASEVFLCQWKLGSRLKQYCCNLKTDQKKKQIV